MSKHRTTARLNHLDTNAENARGYFVQNEHGATVAGPFETKLEAWAEEDRLNALSTVEAST